MTINIGDTAKLSATVQKLLERGLGAVSIRGYGYRVIVEVGKARVGKSLLLDAEVTRVDSETITVELNGLPITLDPQFIEAFEPGPDIPPLFDRPD